MSEIVWKAMGAASGIVAQKAAVSVMDKAWARARGGEPPRNPAAYGTTWGEALVWAMASGAAIGVARMVATRAAASTYRITTGHLPAGLEEVGT